MKTIIAGIGFVLTMVGASCDIDKSDMRVVAAVVLIGCFFMWIGGKGDYEYEAEAQEKENGVHQELDIDCCFSTLFDRLGVSFPKARCCRKN